MKNNNFGFLRVACVTPNIKTADVTSNAEEIIQIIKDAEDLHVGLLLFPELCLTGSKCGSLFHSKHLYDKQVAALGKIIETTKDLDVLVATGIYEWDKDGMVQTDMMFGGGELILAEGMETALDMFQNIKVGFLKNADVQFIMANEDVSVGQMDYYKNYISMLSSQNHNVVLYANENGSKIIAENGKILASTSPFEDSQGIVVDVDIDLVKNARSKVDDAFLECDETLTFELDSPIPMWNDEKLLRYVSNSPFMPDNPKLVAQNCREIFEIQANALANRLQSIHSQASVIGISGGLDSTLALLVTAYAHKKLNKPMTDIIAITMPGFGTTGRTHNNALTMMKSLGVTIKEISIVDAVTQHLKDIEHDIDDHNTTYENAQARERTQILMDVANKFGGIVVGTGDLSEAALGWCTYNGDHMSMYNVNCNLPKTVIRKVVHWIATDKLLDKDTFATDSNTLAITLLDILDTPISPELLPPDQAGNIKQKTEDKVGPYELHDFFIYHTVLHGISPKKLVFIASIAFADKYDETYITKWLKVFYKRFFTQQFKRNCAPDGPKIGSVDISYNEWQMPSDASYNLWLDELN